MPFVVRFVRSGTIKVNGFSGYDSFAFIVRRVLCSRIDGTFDGSALIRQISTSRAKHQFCQVSALVFPKIQQSTYVCTCSSVRLISETQMDRLDESSFSFVPIDSIHLARGYERTRHHSVCSRGTVTGINRRFYLRAAESSRT